LRNLPITSLNICFAPTKVLAVFSTHFNINSIQINSITTYFWVRWLVFLVVLEWSVVFAVVEFVINLSMLKTQIKIKQTQNQNQNQNQT
jgi:hypothetical protein